ncbi:hypothetical protein D918_03257 [Trichuris suis]|nr:hypothetical protein D918_03257 [Trichuris suis]
MSNWLCNKAGNPLAAPTPLLMLSREGNTAPVRDQRLLHNRMPEGRAVSKLGLVIIVSLISSGVDYKLIRQEARERVT